MKRVKGKIRILFFSSLTVITVFVILAFQGPSIKTSRGLDIFFSFFRDINIMYVDKTDPEKLIYTGIDAMLQSLDPYSEFISEENSDELDFQTTGEYGGMGALIQEYEGFPMVAEIYEGSPAQKAGLQVGDQILVINGISVNSVAIDKASKMLKGLPKTDLTLKIKRLNIPDTLTFSFKREKIHIPSVPYYGMIENGIGYIRLGSFTSDTYKETEKALKELMKSDAKSIIVDLRGNPGGLLHEAVRVVNLFVPRNQLVVYTKGQLKDFDQEYKTASKPLNTDIPLVVLVDRSSASASEIVAGALQDIDRAVIIGERTFGKGLVQSTRELPHNTKMKITTAKYYIPSGRCIQAIDWAKKNEDGSIHYIPDSLMKPFKTKNGRTVYDGGGILPDIVMEPRMPNELTINLYNSRSFFKYATLFRLKNSSINSPNEFYLTNEEFNSFSNFTIQEGFKFQTRSQKVLDELIRTSKENNYFEKAKPFFDSLSQVVNTAALVEIERNRNEIKIVLEDEIVGRYYFQRGRFQRFVKRDDLVKKAIDVLKNPKQFTEIISSPKNPA